MYRWISSTGEIVKTKTIKEFADKYGIRHSTARVLACGARTRHKGWCSTSPRAKKARERFTTELVNINTGERSILGQRLTDFAARHGLSPVKLSRLVNKHRLIYRGWALASTLRSANLA